MGGVTEHILEYSPAGPTPDDLPRVDACEVFDYGAKAAVVINLGTGQRVTFKLAVAELLGLVGLGE